MNVSEPLMRYRENVLSAKTIGSLLPEEEYSGHLSTGYMAGVIERA